MGSILNCGLVVATVAMGACSSLPDVHVSDRLADERARKLARDSVWVIDAKDARRFTDPAWPSPIQIVPPKHEGGGAPRKSHVYLFGSAPSGNEIDVVYVRDGGKKECQALIDYLGINVAESVLVEINNGGGDVYRCDSVVFSMGRDDPKGMTRNPFITHFQQVEISLGGAPNIGSHIGSGADENGAHEELQAEGERSEDKQSMEGEQSTMSVPDAIDGRYPIRIRYLK